MKVTLLTKKSEKIEKWMDVIHQRHKIVLIILKIATGKSSKGHNVTKLKESLGKSELFLLMPNSKSISAAVGHNLARAEHYVCEMAKH